MGEETSRTLSLISHLQSLSLLPRNPTKTACSPSVVRTSPEETSRTSSSTSHPQSLLLSPNKEPTQPATPHQLPICHSPTRIPSTFTTIRPCKVMRKSTVPPRLVVTTLPTLPKMSLVTPPNSEQCDVYV